MTRNINKLDLGYKKGASDDGHREATPTERVFEQAGGSLPTSMTHEERLRAPIIHAERLVDIGRRAARSAAEGVAETLVSLSLVEQAGRESRSTHRNNGQE